MSSRVITARWILPMDRDPISRGWIELAGDKIVAMGSDSPPTGAQDLGDVALMPGLVNAHTHLEFSDFAEPVGHRGIAFDQWIGKVIQARQQRDDSPAIIQQGIRESIQSGVRLIGEIATPPVKYPPLDSRLQIVSFAEVLGLSPERAAERFAAMEQHAATNSGAGVDVGVSPHAPYSTRPETIERCVAWSAKTGKPLAMHVAESPAERELLVSGTGVLAGFLRQMGTADETLFPRGSQLFVDLIKTLARASSGLLVHGNDLREDEIELLAQHSNLSVVYCPRTHHFFDFPRHPVSKLLAAGVRVALGTDSRASNPDLNLWNEVRFLLNHRMDLDPKDVLAMATISGADALQRPEIGRIAVGSRPGLIAVSTSASSQQDLYGDLADGQVGVIDIG